MGPEGRQAADREHRTSWIITQIVRQLGVNKYLAQVLGIGGKL